MGKSFNFECFGILECTKEFRVETLGFWLVKRGFVPLPLGAGNLLNPEAYLKPS